MNQLLTLLPHPFRAQAHQPRPGRCELMREVWVDGPAPAEEGDGGGPRVEVRDAEEGEAFRVPLAALRDVQADDATVEAIERWKRRDREEEPE